MTIKRYLVGMGIVILQLIIIGIAVASVILFLEGYSYLPMIVFLVIIFLVFSWSASQEFYK